MVQIIEKRFSTHHAKDTTIDFLIGMSIWGWEGGFIMVDIATLIDRVG